jgi:hypothetical protein
MLITRRRVAMTVMATVIGFASALSGDTSPEERSSSSIVWQLTFLKAEAGQRERLERFITLNWFGPDERARQRGYISGFQLLRGSETDTSWDLLVVDIFPDSDAHTKARERYRNEIMPAHKKQLVDGYDLASLGRIVAERTTTVISGHLEPQRLGIGNSDTRPPSREMQRTGPAQASEPHR